MLPRLNPMMYRIPLYRKAVLLSCLVHPRLHQFLQMVSVHMDSKVSSWVRFKMWRVVVILSFPQIKHNQDNGAEYKELHAGLK